MRKVVLRLALVLTVIWILLGYDSGVGMIENAVFSLPDLFSGAITFQEWLQIPSEFYGKTMHFSALVIYGLLYYGLSKHFSKIGIVKSKNVAYSFALTLLSIAIFEYFWIYSFSHFQSQVWVSTWVWPQLRILSQNVYMALVGILTILYIYADNYKLNLNWKSLVIVAVTFGSALFWIYYPLPVEQISVELSSGLWTSSLRFPQTLYTIDLNLMDGDNSGVWFFVENDMIHTVNNVVKVLFAYSCYYIFKIIPPKKEGIEWNHP